MQVIRKAKDYSLPHKLARRINTDKSQTKLPAIPHPKHHRRRSILDSSQHQTITYSRVEDERGAIRDALSKKMNFEHVEGCENSFISQTVFDELSEKVAALNYSSEEYPVVMSLIERIFGQDFSVSNHDILVGRGSVTAFFYIFFTAAYYRPHSFCCKSMIYIRLEPAPSHPSTQYSRKRQTFKPDANHFISFICSNCKKIVLRLKQASKKQPIKNKQEQSLEVQRKGSMLSIERRKIMMSIMVASGRYKKMRIDQVDISYNPEQRKRSLEKQRYTMPLKGNELLVSKKSYGEL